MRKILVTGADGQLGRSLRRFGAASPNTYLYTDRAELDITDREAVMRYIAAERPEVIVNCAAYTNVERAEEEPAEAEALNVTAVQHLAEAAAAHGATLIHISTDYVFDGCSTEPYTEESPTAPRSAYGATKEAGERAVATSGCRHLIFRTAWLYSEFGSNFLKTMIRLTAEREAINVVFDQTGTPTYAGDLALAIFSIIEGEADRTHEGIYHFSDEGVSSWYDFAVEIARAIGTSERCRIHPCRTADYPTRAQRPAYSVLDKTKLKRDFGIEIPHWRESLHYCLHRIVNAK